MNDRLVGPSTHDSIAQVPMFPLAQLVNKTNINHVPHAILLLKQGKDPHPSDWDIADPARTRYTLVQHESTKVIVDDVVAGCMLVGVLNVMLCLPNV